MCDNPWTCHNPEPHEPPRGCVHHAADGSSVDDKHRDGGHG